MRIPRGLEWKPIDPGGFALRSAIRAAIVAPAVLAIGRAVGGAEVGLFAVFGAIALLIFVDFGGPRGARLVAYTALVVAGAVLIVVGTLCSTHPVLAAATMAVLGFAILFAGIINGYLAAAAPATLLAYILPSMVPATASHLPDLLLGWTLAGVISVPAVLLVFPSRPRDRVRAGVASACTALARFVGEPSPKTHAAAKQAIDAMHGRFEATPFRPTGPTGATGALAEIIDELDWLLGLASDRAGTEVSGPPLACEKALRAQSAEALGSCAALIEGHAGDRPDRDALERERTLVIDDVLKLLSDPSVQEDDERLWTVIARVWNARVISYAALAIAEQATIVGGLAEQDGSVPRWLAFIRRQSVALTASGRVIAAHARIRSIWFRNSVRGAVGLSIAVLLAQITSQQHAFWVVLGSLTVLRSSALGTGATIVQALVGTTIGIVIGGLLLTGIGANEAVSWAILPLSVLLAAYAPRAISFAAGQVGFTVAVFVVFNIIQPTDWHVGLIRLEDVSIGFGISLLVGALFWPRGASALLRTSIATAIATSARYAASALRGILAGGGLEESVALAGETVAAQSRLDAAMRQRLAERSGEQMHAAEVSRFSVATGRLRRSADAELSLARMIGDATRPDASARLLTDVASLADWYVQLGAAFAARTAVPGPQAADPLARAAMLEAVRHVCGHGERDEQIAALACAWAGLHVDLLRRLEARVAQAAVALG